MRCPDWDQAALADLRADADFAERQACEGPYFPARGITKELLTAYAKTVRDKIASGSWLTVEDSGTQEEGTR